MILRERLLAALARINPQIPASALEQALHALQAGDRDELREMLASREAGGIIFTTVQKFALLDGEETHPLLSGRTNIVVISDEAHRSQYGTKGRLDTQTGKYVSAMPSTCAMR